jgi:DNA-directed RNA polymerase I, II, and III subunit RPABC2
MSTPIESRKTSCVMTKYERTRILGVRATQISKGAPIMIELPPNVSDPLQIAQLELLQKRIPLIVSRVLPDGSTENWKVSEMTIQ